MNKINEIVSEIKTEDSLVDNLKEITPAQCFIDDMAITTAFFSEIQDDNKGKRRVKVPYLITSNKDKIKLDPEELLRRGYYSERNPNYDQRWQISEVKKFICSDSTAVSKEVVFEQIKNQYKKYIDCGDERWSDVLACWVIGTYFHRIFATYPYIHLNGNMEAGKSKTMFLTMLLSFNGEMSVNSSPSYMIRTIHDNNASCGIDEAEKLGGGGDDEKVLGAIFNSGYKKGTYVGKSEKGKNDKWTPKRFESYSPKIFGGIKRIDSTLASRSITITMIRTDNKEIKNREINTSDKVLQEIIDGLHNLMMTIHLDIRDIYLKIEDTDILGREWELWRPILSIAKSISSELYQKLRIFALETQAQKKDIMSDDTNVIKLLETILEMTADQLFPTFYTISSIADFFIDIKSPYANDFAWMIGKNLKRWIGDELRKAGVINGQSKQQKIDGQNTRGYVLDRELIVKRLAIYRQS